MRIASARLWGSFRPTHIRRAAVVVSLVVHRDGAGGKSIQLISETQTPLTLLIAELVARYLRERPPRDYALTASLNNKNPSLGDQHFLDDPLVTRL